MNYVLLVEDNADNRLVIEDIFEFEELGATLEVVETAEEALKRIAARRPLLVLMDLGLPGMSGLEAVRRLREDPGAAPLAIWALTAHAMKTVKDEAVEAGCDAYVTKPVDVADLTRRLRGFIAQCGGTIVA
jgi:CheY-like chemotaxis protein